MTTAAFELPSRDPGALARWGRAAMASYFVVGATLDAAAHPEVWAALGAGAATAIDWLVALRVAALVVSAVLFALGRFTGVIARAWIAFCAVRLFAGPLPWEGGVQGVATHGMAAMADVAVAASLMLYLGSRERLAAVAR
jgi:hypothetical protein